MSSTKKGSRVGLGAGVKPLFDEIQADRAGDSPRIKKMAPIPREIQREQLKTDIQRALQEPCIANLPVNSDEFLSVVSFFAELVDIKCHKGWMHEAGVITRARLHFSGLTSLRQRKVNWGIRTAQQTLYNLQNSHTSPDYARELINA